MASLTIPTYIKRSGVDGKEIDYKWTSGGGSDIYDRTNEKLTDAIERLSPRAVVAICLGMGEWVLWRLHRHCLPEAFDYLEAAWAAVVDFRYYKGRWTSPQDLNLFTPALEPQNDMLSLLSRGVRAVEMRLSGSQEANYIAFLAKHIVRNNPAYQEWLTACLSRLTLLYPISHATNEYQFKSVHTETERANYDWGPPIPREALDPAIDFKVETATPYLDSYLKTLNYRNNRFLRSPEEMAKLGFVGTPYTYPPH